MSLRQEPGSCRQRAGRARPEDTACRSQCGPAPVTRGSALCESRLRAWGRVRGGRAERKGPWLAVWLGEPLEGVWRRTEGRLCGQMPRGEDETRTDRVTAADSEPATPEPLTPAEPGLTPQGLDPGAASATCHFPRGLDPPNCAPTAPSEETALMGHHPSDSLTLSSSGLPIRTQSMPLSLPWAPGDAPAGLTGHSPLHLQAGQNKAALAPPLAPRPHPPACCSRLQGPPGSRVPAPSAPPTCLRFTPRSPLGQQPPPLSAWHGTSFFFAENMNNVKSTILIFYLCLAMLGL